jgi:hypothetical protein
LGASKRVDTLDGLVYLFFIIAADKVFRFRSIMLSNIDKRPYRKKREQDTFIIIQNWGHASFQDV